MELLLVLLISAYVVKGVGSDVAAAVAGKTPPSVLKWEARQKARERPKRDPGYLGRIWHNALEDWADRSTRRHNRKMALRARMAPKKDAEWLAKQERKAAKVAARREQFATKRRVLWGKAREAAENVRERRREDQAWAENARRDAAADTTVPAGLPGSTDLPDNKQDNDDQGEATVLPFRPRPDDAEQPDTTTDQPATGQDTETNTQEEPPMSMPTPNAEITSLSDAIEYTKAMGDSLASNEAHIEQWSAELRAFAEKCRAESAQLEAAVASLREAGNEGDRVNQIEAAREHLDVMAQAAAKAAEQVSAASDSVQAGAAAFRQAHGGFTAQTGIQEQIQAAAASGNRAAKREFYEMA